MDFKVAGTEQGITSLQMDIKITSITEEIMQVALQQAKDGRLHILNEMEQAINQGREGVSDHAPRVTTLTINKDKIRDIIGPGGKVIREICESTGAKIDIDDEGVVKVAAVDNEAGQAAIEWIRSIVAEPELGVIYNGKVVKTVDFGAVPRLDFKIDTAFDNSNNLNKVFKMADISYDRDDGPTGSNNAS